MMKIRYKKLICPTNLSQSDLIRNILRELDRPGYYIAKHDTESVEFGYNIWRFGSRSEVFRRIDGGTFEIIPDAKAITFSFYISTTFEVLASIVVIIIALTKDHQILVFLVFIWVMFIVRTVSVKQAGNQMMTNVSEHS